MSSLRITICLALCLAAGSAAAQAETTLSAPDPTGIAYEPSDPNALVTFNLEDADLAELVRMMSQITGRAFILANKMRSIKATVYAPTRVRAADAYEAFISILDSNGMTVVPAGRYLKVVETAKIESRALPLSIDPNVIPASPRSATPITIRTR